ncbi:MAG: hypothetical protein IPN95_30285 [Bacteroidetes bacterium]|nr:hypothetical protein [Bacteroidota bacterium]
MCGHSDYRAVTEAISRLYDTKDIGKFPKRLPPKSFRSPLTSRADVMSFNEIYRHLSLTKLGIYAPVSYILQSRMRKYEDMYDTKVEGGKGKLRQIDRERSLQSPVKYEFALRKRLGFGVVLPTGHGISQANHAGCWKENCILSALTKTLGSRLE